jgi:flagellar basal-body rod modification protein FlgD
MAIDAVGASPATSGNDLSAPLKSNEIREVEQEANRVNQSLTIAGRQVKQTLDKNDFLTLLVAQLKNQDPANPVEDKQFIAQMAQFTTLEQMNNMGEGFKKLTGLLTSSQTASMLGKQVDVQLGEKTVSGPVTEVTSGDFPQVMVDGNYYDYSAISRIRQN